jgi:hypothetical protein
MATSEGQHLATSMNEMRKKVPKGVQLETGAENKISPRFPAQYFKHTDKDDRLKLLEGIATNYGKNFNIPLEDWVLNYYEDKKKALEYAQFEKWIQNTYDLSDPNHVRLLQEVHPEYFKIREDYITSQLELVKRFELVKLRGPQSREDLIFVYMLLNDPDFVMPEIMYPDISGKDEAAQLKRGMLSLKKWIGGDGKNMKVPTSLGQVPYNAGAEGGWAAAATTDRKGKKGTVGTIGGHGGAGWNWDSLINTIHKKSEDDVRVNAE